MTCTSPVRNSTFSTPASRASAIDTLMNGSATSMPTAAPSGPISSASCCVVSPKPQPISSTRSPGLGGCSRIAISPWRLRPTTMRSRNLTKRSKRTPLQASVASSFSAATRTAAPFSTGQWYAGQHCCYTSGVIRMSIAALVVAAAVGAAPAAKTDGPSPYQAALHLSGKIGHRAAASRGETRAQRYVAGQFRSAGLTVSVERFGVPGKGTSRNVVGELDGPASCLQILVAHVDSGPDGPGANDNASGVGVLIALADELKGLNPPCDVWLASTGAEERGFTHARDHLGAAALVARVKRLGRAGDLRFAYDNDEVGRLGRFWLRSPVSAPRPGVEGAFLAAAHRAGVTVRWVRDEGTGNSDEREFNLAGLGAAVLEGWHAQEPCRELPCDRPGRLHKRSLNRALNLAEEVVKGS